MKIGIALGGGGFKGAFQAGAFRALPDALPAGASLCIRGISTGALSGLVLAQEGVRQAAPVLEAFYLEREKRDYTIEYGTLLSVLRLLFGKRSIMSNEPLRQMLHGYVDRDRLRAVGYDYGAGAVNLDSGALHFWQPDEPGFVEGVLASTAIPFAWSPSTIDGALWVDGGVRDVNPIGETLNQGVDHVIIIPTSPVDRVATADLGTDPSLVPFLQRVVSIMTDDNMIGDVDKFLKINEALGPGGRQGDLRYVPYTLIVPDEPLGSEFTFDKAAFRRWIQHGEEKARAALAESPPVPPV